MPRPGCVNPYDDSPCGSGGTSNCTHYADSDTIPPGVRRWSEDLCGNAIVGFAICGTEAANRIACTENPIEPGELRAVTLHPCRWRADHRQDNGEACEHVVGRWMIGDEGALVPVVCNNARGLAEYAVGVACVQQVADTTEVAVDKGALIGVVPLHLPMWTDVMVSSRAAICAGVA